jgi:Tol biopolymer transport system component
MIREVPDEPGRGTLHPHFSHDGRMLTWSEMHAPGSLRKGQEVGYWYLMVGDLNWTGGKPSLSNVRNVTPAGPGFYEVHGFSRDDSKILFSSNFEAKHRLENDIYVLDLRSKRLTRLTSGGWNEHAQYSPDGRYIAWMSNADDAKGGADYWIMNADGSNKRRLTFFNRKGSPEYRGGKTMVADIAWRPDGRAIAGYTGGKVITTSTKDPSSIVLIELPPS